MAIYKARKLLLLPNSRRRVIRLQPQIDKAIVAFFDECDDIMLAIMAAGVPRSRIVGKAPSWRRASNGNIEMDFYYGFSPENREEI